jgi:DNA (cytosine-5)-methyltransferase 1
MLSNRRTGTGPEKALRSALFRAGVRFRKDYPIECDDLRVRADVAIVGKRVAVFVDGCFWHRCPEHGSDPKTNAGFWAEKLDRNVARDRRVDAALRRSGWMVVRAWEHELAEDAAARVLDALNGRESLRAPLTAVDLFCGVGGLSAGLRGAGFSVLGAVDVSELAIRGYQSNHPETTVWQQNIRSLSPMTMMEALGLVPGQLDLLAGCPPCQGFSTMRTLRRGTSVADKRNSLVAQFGRYAAALQPRALMMENVPGLADDPVLGRLVKRLRSLGYAITTGIHDAADYGVPQRRRRFVLLGIRQDQPVPFADPVSRQLTVRDALSALPQPAESDDPLHNHGERRSRRIRNLIAAIPHDGGGQSDLPRRRQLACHRRTQGFFDVYGRMAWDRPAPTITSGCINPSKGRFLHPEQDRAITLREAALLQTFPSNYRFPLEAGKYKAADLIGNALPPAFVKRHADPLVAALARSVP